MGRLGSTPRSASTDSPGTGSAGYQTSVSIPLRTTWTRPGSTVGYTRSTSSRMPELTAITASAAFTAVCSTHDEIR